MYQNYNCRYLFIIGHIEIWAICYKSRTAVCRERKSNQNTKTRLDETLLRAAQCWKFTTVSDGRRTFSCVKISRLSFRGLFLLLMLQWRVVFWPRKSLILALCYRVGLFTSLNDAKSPETKKRKKKEISQNITFKVQATCVYHLSFGNYTQINIYTFTFM